MDNLDLRLKLLSGQPIEIPNAGLLYPVTLGDIARIGYTRYSQMMFVLTLDPKDIIKDQEISDVNTFDLVFGLKSKDIEDVFKESIKMMFRVDEPYYSLSYGLFLDKDKSFNRLITSVNYPLIREYIEYTNCIRGLEEAKIEAENSIAKRIAEKLKKGKEIVNKLKQNSDSDAKIDISDIISAVTAKSNSINKLNVWDLTVFQLYDEYKRLNAIDSYDTSLQGILHGADSKKINIKHWSSRIE